MTFSIRTIIRDLVASECRLSCPRNLWVGGLAELRRRGAGRRESGAFLLGTRAERLRRIQRFVYYDDLDPHCLDRGYVVFDGAGYGPLWDLCRKTGLEVVADVHTHPGAPFQSGADRMHPMVAVKGHIALIVPDFAKRVFQPHELGIYEYEGGHRWGNHSGGKGGKFFYIGTWG